MTATAAAARGASGPATTRRGALLWSGLGTLGLILLQALIAFVVFFWPRKRGAFGSRISMGKVDQYEVGSVTYKVEGKFYLVHLAEGFIALYQKCPHLGCTVPWRPHFSWPYEGRTITGLFRCPCHGSTYLPNGQIIYGPAPRPMDYMRITIDDRGRITVDTADIRQRAKYDPSQVVRA